MSDLSQDQQELQQSIKKSALRWAVILGVILALVVYWILGSQEQTVRLAGSIVAGGAAGFSLFKSFFASKSKAALCSNCSAAFSTTKSDSAETLSASEAKTEREEQDDGSVKVTSWMEEKYDVVDTYKCSSCDHLTTKEYQVTRRKDEQTKVDPAPVPVVEKPTEVNMGGKPSTVQTGGKPTEVTARKTEAGTKAKTTPRNPSGSGGGRSR